MKRRIIAVLCIILLMFISCSSSFICRNKKISYRYEQHIQALKMHDSGSIENNDLVSHLPLISINTYEQKIPGFPIRDENENVIDYEKGDNGEEEIKVEIKIYDNQNAQNSIKNVENLNAKAMFRIRGNSSRSFDKSSYKITFIADSEEKKEYSVMGMGESDEWALYGPFLDKTLIRNYMWLNISGKIMGYAPNVRFCECYVDGKYKGLYVMMETIKKSEQRVNISTYDSNNRSIPYIVKMDKYKENEVDALPTFSYYSSHLDYNAGFTILYPKKEDLTENVKKYIENSISDFEKSLYSYDFKDSKKGYEKYIDVDSWVDFYIIQEFLANNDMCSRSTYLYKDIGGKICIKPVWDFNNVCDNYLAVEYSPEGFYFTQNRIWYNMLFKDKKFVRKVEKRYKELRKTVLNPEYLNNYIDETIKYLGDAIDRNYQIWGYTYKRENQVSKAINLVPIERNPQSYEEAIEKYKKFIDARGKWLDQNIDTLDQYCHTSRNKLYVK